METKRATRSWLRRLGYGAVATGMLLAVTGLVATGAQAEPPADPWGDNGTVKIDGLDSNLVDCSGHSTGSGCADSPQPENDPHVVCGFEVEFYGFDLGQTADIVFTAQPPTGTGGVLLAQNGVTISDDAAGGAADDPDARFEYDLTDFDMSQFSDPHDTHGYHVKLSITLYDAQGNDIPGNGSTKHKVFWVEPCAPTPPPPPTFGSMSVDKALAGNDSGSQTNTAFPFTVACVSNGQPVVLAPADASFTLTDAQQPHLISGLPTGATCTVTEVGYPNVVWSGGGSSNNDGTRTVTIGVDTTVAVVATNTFTTGGGGPTFGSLSVNKDVTGAGAPTANTEFSFEIDCSNGVEQSVELTAGEAAHVISGLPTGTTCTIVETDDGDADGTTWTGGTAIPNQNGVSVTIGNGTTVAVTATNDFELEVQPIVVVAPPVVTPPVVTPPVVTPPAPPTKVAGVVVARTLPRTGSTTLPLLQVGLGMVLLGAGAMLFGRERTALIWSGGTEHRGPGGATPALGAPTCSGPWRPLSARK